MLGVFMVYLWFMILLWVTVHLWFMVYIRFFLYMHIKHLWLGDWVEGKGIRMYRQKIVQTSNLR